MKKKNFTIREKENGELAVRKLSEGAQRVCDEYGYMIKMYAVIEDADSVQLSEDETDDEFVTRYYIRGDLMHEDCLTLKKLESKLVEYGVS